MDIELRDRWIAALESGEYEKGKRVLRDSYDDTYCCLGVLGALCNVIELRDVWKTYEMGDSQNQRTDLHRQSWNLNRRLGQMGA